MQQHNLTMEERIKRGITVFTPTFNRSYIIDNLYESLKRQTNKSFEWLVIDDGSTDDTEDKFKQYIQKENEFPIRYFKKENGGQHRALNIAIQEANGGLLFIVDSDDYISDDAIETLYEWMNTINKEEELISGISGPKGNINGGIVGNIPDFNGQYLDISETECDKFHMAGDKLEAHFVDVLRKYGPIETFEGENSAEKGILWLRVARAGYRFRYFKKVIYYCEYLSDGMSAKKLKTWLNNFNGYTVYMKELYLSEKNLLKKIKRLCTYTIIARQKGLSYADIKRNINTSWPYIIMSIIVINVIHKGIMRKRFSWMLSVDNGDSFNALGKHNT